MEETGKVVLVTGASGFIASWIIKQLLDSDEYRVRGTVRSDPTSSKYDWIRELDTEGRLELFEADLLVDDSYDEAIAGADFVIHTASPFVVEVKDPYKELVEPAVKGTLNVLNAAAKSGTVRRVVITSSMAAITDEPKKDYVYTEKDWNELSSLTRNPYHYSKKKAEESAWEFVKENDVSFSLVTINPFVVIGPTVGSNPNINTSNGMLKSILLGEFGPITAFAWSFIDVRDVAKAHILAIERKEASGRYIAGNESITMKDLVEHLRNNGYNKYKLPKMDLSCGIGSKLVKAATIFESKGMASYIRTNLNTFPLLSTEKAKSELGLEFIPPKKSILETMEDLIAKGLIEDKRE